MIDEWNKGAKYWDKCWNPVIGCTSISEGCAHCYAKVLINRFHMTNNEIPEYYDNFDYATGPHHKDKMTPPPQKGVVFCGNMTDLFGNWVDEKEIHDWFEQFGGQCKKVNYLLLTKRMEFMSKCVEDFGMEFDDRNIWYGMTAENQARFDERIIPMCAIAPSYSCWLSAEPLLGPIDFKLKTLTFRWVVVGAESGPKRRPCDIEWVRAIVKQCLLAGVKVFVKQLDINGKCERDINKFPEDLQIRQVPWR
jgi:protein gp37